MNSRISVGPPCAAKSESTIRVAVDRLTRAVDGLEGLVSSVASAFGPVIFNKPTTAEPVNECGPPHGSDLGQELTKLADRFERSNRSIYAIVDQADV